uniref:Proteasome 20S subunit beta 1 n=1 Tax=Leptobrachium leishanense TaxID=445787 RepID=A0A8C5PB25_9ANUR
MRDVKVCKIVTGKSGLCVKSSRGDGYIDKEYFVRILCQITSVLPTGDDALAVCLIVVHDNRGRDHTGRPACASSKSSHFCSGELVIQSTTRMYKHSNNKTMTSGAIAAMLSTILYSRRFFPYYVYNIIGGLDEEGKGAVYSFDPVGSYQRDSYKAGGSASAMLQPLLDNQIGYKNMQNAEQLPLTLEKAIQLVKDVFISAAERDVYTGDALKICVVTKDGIKEESISLRKD